MGQAQLRNERKSRPGQKTSLPGVKSSRNQRHEIRRKRLQHSEDLEGDQDGEYADTIIEGSNIGTRNESGMNRAIPIPYWGGMSGRRMHSTLWRLGCVGGDGYFKEVSLLLIHGGEHRMGVKVRGGSKVYYGKGRRSIQQGGQGKKSAGNCASVRGDLGKKLRDVVHHRATICAHL